MTSATCGRLKNNDVVGGTGLENRDLADIQLKQTTGGKAQGLGKGVKRVTTIPNEVGPQPEDTCMRLLISPKMDITKNRRLGPPHASMRTIRTQWSMEPETLRDASQRVARTGGKTFGFRITACVTDCIATIVFT
jgi:hypothetical protein